MEIPQQAHNFFKMENNNSNINNHNNQIPMQFPNNQQSNIVNNYFSMQQTQHNPQYNQQNSNNLPYSYLNNLGNLNIVNINNNFIPPSLLFTSANTNNVMQNPPVKENKKQVHNPTTNQKPTKQNKKDKEDDYIIEMFGRIGWICDQCNNFNYDTRTKCNRCGVPKSPKKITKLKKKLENKQKELLKQKQQQQTFTQGNQIQNQNINNMQMANQQYQMYQNEDQFKPTNNNYNNNTNSNTNLNKKCYCEFSQ